MKLIYADRMLKKIKNPYERAEVERWVNTEEPVNITWTSTAKRETKRYCKTSGYLCEFATEYGNCQITACVKRENQWIE